MMSTARFVFFILWCVPASVLAQSDYGKLRFACDASASNVRITDAGAKDAAAKAPFTSSIINWAALIKLGPQKNLRGERIRTGTRTETRSCGVYTVRVRGGYLSPNPTGESGAYEFAVLDVLIKEKPILSKLNLGYCEEPTRHFAALGACDKQWAIAVEVAWDAQKQVSRVTLHHSYEDKSSEPRESKETREVR